MRQKFFGSFFQKRTASFLTPLVSSDDRGFTLGDGLFETVRVVLGQPAHLLLHLARLRRGAALLGIALPENDDAIGRAIHALAAGHDAAVRITLTRGRASRGVWPQGPTAPTLRLAVSPLPAAPSGARMVIAQCTRRNEYSPLSGIKSLNYLDSILAAREAVLRGADDALMLNTQGRIAEASAANLFVFRAGGWTTPPVSDGALPGIARGLLMGVLGAAEAVLMPADIVGCEGAFVSNALGLRVILSVDGVTLPTRTLPDQP